MPKEPKQKKKIAIDPISKLNQQHAPLGQVIRDDIHRAKYAKQKKRNNDGSDSDDNGNASDQEEFMDEKTSKRILELGRSQLVEETEGAGAGGAGMMRDDFGSDEEVEDVELIEDDGGVVHDGGYVSVKGPELSEEQEAVVSAMMGGTQYEERKTLADIILAKIKEKEEAAAMEDSSQNDNKDDLADGMDLPPKVVEVYTDIGQILARYRSGKLPKAFKIIPSLHNWEEILYLTSPHEWTPQATFAATRIFASNLNPKMAQRFYNLVLLDSIRADISQNAKLNYHYFNALIKAAYKPAAFFKGIILPLAKPESQCTLREAAIIASALRRVSIPVHHAAVAIQKMAVGVYSAAASIFLKEMLNKKYSLPSPVITALVMEHFGKFRFEEHAELPVLWHQSLLVFVQRYKGEIEKVEEFKVVLKDVMRVHNHAKITREVRRELFGSAAFKEERRVLTGDGEDMEL